MINCAAYTAVDNCEKEPEQCLAVNGLGPEILARETVDIKARLFHVSTDYVFSGDKPVPEAHKEDEPVNPISQYGKSKLAGEEAVRRLNPEHLIIRTAWLYGIGGKNFLKTMLRLAVADPRRTIRVVNDQFGSPTWTYRLALQINELLSADLRGTIHATAENHCTWYEAADKFLTAMDTAYSLAPCTTEEYPTPARRPANSILENSRLKEHGLNVMRPWDEDVELFARRFHDELLAETGS